MTTDSPRLEPKPLHGRLIELQPYSEALRPEVQRMLDCDPEGWKLFSICGAGAHFDSWWARLTGGMADGNWLPYAVRRLSDGVVVGTTSFTNIRPRRQTVEIGATFLSPAVRSGYANPEAKLLMLQYAFESGMRRVELLTDQRNLRSQRAIAKLGAVREGVLRRDRVTWTGHVRDSVIYSITDLDWPVVENGLRRRLAASEK